MNRLFYLSALIGACWLPLSASGYQDTWINNGTIAGIPPTIDATNIINNGTMSPLALVSLFDTSNTKNFTNSGTIANSPFTTPLTSAVGFRFDNAPRDSSGQLTGQRKLLANFHNRNSGVISAVDGLNLGAFFGSAMLVHATNIVNQGLLTVGPGGLLQLVGTNVNLSRGGFGAAGVESAAQGSFNNSPIDGNFSPDIAITDNYWAQANETFRIDGLFNGNVVITPPHRIELPGGGAQNNFAFGMNAYVSSALSNVLQTVSLTITNIDGTTTNLVVPTNAVMQAVFVGITDTNQPVSITFVPSSQPTNDYSSAIVTLGVPGTNVFTGQAGFNTIYLQDTLAGEADRGLMLNYGTTLGGVGATFTYRPAAYIISRVTQDFGTPGNTIVGTNFFYGPNFATNRVTGDYAAYSAHFDNIIVRPPNIPAGTATNLTGRTEVNADSLDISRARVRGEGLVSLKARHLVASTNAAVDCENVSFLLGSTNGLLRIKDITRETVQRIRGDVLVYSAQWSNSISTLITNYDTTVITNPILSMITNTVNVNFSVTVYETRGLATTVPAFVQQFNTTATNIVMDDNANVALELLIKGQSFTLNGRMTLTSLLTDWYATNSPTLRYFTNNGSLTVPNEAHFGDDAAQNYLGFVNRGIISSYGQNIDSVYTELAGTNLVIGSFNVEGVDTKVESGRIAAGGDIFITGSTLKFNRALLQADNRIIFNVSGALLDNGGTSSNTITCGDGVILTTKPATGDLLGTSLRTVAPIFGLVDHYWPGDDRGATKAGFTNNLALGRLTPVPDGIGTGFGFIGTGAANGLYVDLLDLTQLTDIADQLLISPNLTIYYAAVKLNFVPPGGLTPEEYMDQQLGGRLRWVSQFNGPNSSVDVVVNGTQTIQVNRALRNSTTIDSDADGVPNYFDLTPFDGVVITSIAPSTAPAGIKLTWNAVPNTIYRVEYSTGPTSGWSQLMTTTNLTGVTKPWTIVDTSHNSGQLRQYRISYNPNGL